jgi:hypothetical protein
MKTKSSISLLIIQTLGNLLFAQVYTPFGTTVEYNSFSAGNVALLENQAATYISNRGWTSSVTKTGSATGTYNCHSYAWYMSEGGANQYWINAFSSWDLAMFNQYSSTSTPPASNNINKYWNDGSYVEVSESQATKVWFGSCWTWNNTLGEWTNNCDHSAIRLSSGLYESKWGQWPRYRHPADKCPYAISNRKYYKKVSPTLAGPPSLCSGASATFTVSNAPTGFTWSCSSNLSPGVASGTTKTFTGNSSSGSFGWVSISIGQTEIARQAVWVGAPEITYISGYYSLGGQSQFHALYQPANPNTTLIWGIYPQGYSYNISNGGNPYLVSFQQPGNYTIMCRAQNECDYGDIYMIDITLGGAVTYASAYPNPASDRINVRFDPEAIAHETARRQQLQQLSQKQSMSGSSRFSDAPASAPAFEIHLYDSKGILQRQAHSTGEIDALLSVSDLPNGVYLLHVYNSWTPLQPEVHTVIIKH